MSEFRSDPPAQSPLPAQAGGWQPIATAPKDRLVDLWIPHGTDGGVRWADCYYDRICDEWRTSRPSGKLMYIRAHHVSHWRLPPDPPAPQPAAEGDCEGPDAEDGIWSPGFLARCGLDLTVGNVLELYENASSLVSRIGMEGEVDSHDAWVHGTMEALRKIDGGIHRDTSSLTKDQQS